MKLPRTLPVLGLFATVAGSAAILFFVLWRDYTLYAVVAGGLLLFGGAALLPQKGHFVHAVSLGLCIGAFIGSALGAAQVFSPKQQTTERTSAVLRQTSSPLALPAVLASSKAMSLCASNLWLYAATPNPSVKGTGLRPAPYVER